MGDVQSFANDAPRLGDQLGIKRRQKRRVITDVIFHYQNDWYADGTRVVKYVALVLDVLHDGNQNADVALPQKQSFDIRDGIAFEEPLDLTVVVGQHHHGSVEAGVLDLARQLCGRHVAHFQVGDDQVETRLRACQGQRFGAAGNLRDPWNLLQVQLKRLADQQFVQTAVFTENVRVVQAGDQKNVMHLERHEILEAFKEALGIDDGIGSVGDGHGKSTYTCHPERRGRSLRERPRSQWTPCF